MVGLVQFAYLAGVVGRCTVRFVEKLVRFGSLCVLLNKATVGVVWRVDHKVCVYYFCLVLKSYISFFY